MQRTRWKSTVCFSQLLLIGVCGVFISSAPALASEALVPHTAEYKIKISVLGGKLHTSFQVTGDGYAATSTIKATGLARLIAHGHITESSTFSNFDDGIRPAEFHSVDSLSSKGEIVDLTFDWDSQEVAGQIDGEDFRADLDGIVHDRVSLQYALMHDLINGGRRDQYSLQDAEKLKLLSVTDMGSKIVKVPFGKFEAIGIQHRAGNSSRVTTLWCAKELGYLPIMIEQHRKGKLKVRAVLAKYTPSVQSVADSAAQ